MGNSTSSRSDSSTSKEPSGKVWLFLHRTWTVMTAERWTRTRYDPSSENSDYVSQYSQYSTCSCSQCRREDGYESSSDLFISNSSMVPYSEEETLKMRRFSFLDEPSSKGKQRPPNYNPEDYATLLRKWGKKTASGLLSLYTNASTTELECNKVKHSIKDYRNPMLTGSEMTLRQFGSVSELLAKLKADLRMAYPSFVQEFVADPLDGVTLLLDLLRAIQLSQSNNSEQATASGTATIKMPPALQRRTLLDELSCLQCLHSCCTRYTDAVRKLTLTSAGLFTLAICIMSNVNKSRVLALQLLSKACSPPTNGHSAVSEAMSTLRLRFGEPVRFRFLAGMLGSAYGQKELLTAGLQFLNAFLNSATNKQNRLYIQAELEQAGYDIDVIKKNVGSNLSTEESIFEEIRCWEKHFIDVGVLQSRLHDIEKENENLKDKVLLLERKVQLLHEEKGVLMSLEQCLKERCSELQGEVHSLKSEQTLKKNFYSTNKIVESGPEDEGISSSECSPTPDDQERPPIYNPYDTDCNMSKNKKTHDSEDEEEETTIEEVIEELRNIVNDAESAAYNQDDIQSEERKIIEEAQVAGKLQIHVDINDYVLSSECEIIPSNLHPQPPRRAKSLVHLFIPSEDYEYGNKELFFENETAYTSEEESDSLLSASRYFLVPAEATNNKVRHSKTSIKRSESFRHIPRALSINKNSEYNQLTPPKPAIRKIGRKVQEDASNKMKYKSLDRLGDCLENFVDIVVTDKSQDKPFRSKSDSGNTSGTSLCRSMSNVLIVSPQVVHKSRLSTHSEEKQKMFLPTKSDQYEVPYYFPRIQEKRTYNSAGFLIKRGHCNAGLYSGQIILDNHLMMSKSREVITLSSNVSGKLSDYPSGLY